MELKDKLLKFIKEGKYDGLKKAAETFGVSKATIWYTLRGLEAEGKVKPQSQYKAI